MTERHSEYWYGPAEPPSPEGEQQQYRYLSGQYSNIHDEPTGAGQAEEICKRCGHIEARHYVTVANVHRCHECGSERVCRFLPAAEETGMDERDAWIATAVQSNQEIAEITGDAHAWPPAAVHRMKSRLEARIAELEGRVAAEEPCKLCAKGICSRHQPPEEAAGLSEARQEAYNNLVEVAFGGTMPADVLPVLLGFVKAVLADERASITAEARIHAEERFVDEYRELDHWKTRAEMAEEARRPLESALRNAERTYDDAYDKWRKAEDARKPLLDALQQILNEYRHSTAPLITRDIRVRSLAERALEENSNVK